jgi:prepilin-type N-terminal cleavage/methylation domain-containing protein
MKKNTREKKYEAFSLVEMLITISIMGVIMILSSTVLTTLIKVSTVSSNKTRARNETEFVLELMRRTIRNSDPSDVFLFDSLYAGGVGRRFNPEDQTIEGATLENIYTESLGENEIANEIHFRPYGFRDWVCLAFFKSVEDEEKGYILWTSAEDLTGNHENCFALDPDDSYLMVLNSEYINISDFEIVYTQSSDGNYVISFEITSEPLNWYLGQRSPISRSVVRRGTISTEGIVW